MKEEGRRMTDEEFITEYILLKSGLLVGKTITDAEVCSKMGIPKSTYFRKKKKLAEKCAGVTRDEATN